MENIINKLIAADDLHWCEFEKKYTSISEEEIRQVIQSAHKNNIFELDDVMKLIDWAVLVKTGNILLNYVLSDRINIVGFDNNEPVFGVKNEY
jgi:hypothetical protein